MSLRVVVWGTGNVGRPALRAVLANPALELSGVIVSAPEKIGRDPMEIKTARLAADGRTLFLQIPDLRPAMQMHFEWNVNAADGTPVRGALYSTIHRVPTAPGR